MHQSRITSTLILSLVIGTPACGAKFVSLGDEDAGTGPGGVVGSGGSSLLGAGGSSVVFGAGGSAGNPGAGGSGDCVCADGAPDMPNYLCADNTTGGPVCERDFNGVCGWFIRACPVNPGAGGSAGVGGGGAVIGSGGSPLIGAGGGGAVTGSGGSPLIGAGGGGAVIGSGGSPLIGAGGAGAVIGSGGSPLIGAGGAGAVTGSGGSPLIGAGGASGCVCLDPVPNVDLAYCANGTQILPVCEIDVTGVCAWTIPGCPVEGAGGASGVGGAISAGGSPPNAITCQYNGALYVEGQSFPAIEPCNTCYCTAAGIACTQYNVC